MYIIEIDGSIHDLEEIKFNDFKKDEYYKFHKFKVFRVISYDYKSLENFKSEYQAYLTTQLDSN